MEKGLQHITFECGTWWGAFDGISQELTRLSASAASEGLLMTILSIDAHNKGPDANAIVTAFYRLCRRSNPEEEVSARKFTCEMIRDSEYAAAYGNLTIKATDFLATATDGRIEGITFSCNSNSQVVGALFVSTQIAPDSTLQRVAIEKSTWWDACDGISQELTRLSASAASEGLLMTILSIDAHNKGPDANAIVTAFYRLCRRTTPQEEVSARKFICHMINKGVDYAIAYDELTKKANDFLAAAKSCRIEGITFSWNSNSRVVGALYVSLEHVAIVPRQLRVAGQLRVMSFNIWVSGGLSLKDCIQAVQDSNADVVCLQEASHTVVQFMALVLGMYCLPTQSVISRFPLHAVTPRETVRILAADLGMSTDVYLCNIHAPAYPYPPYELKRHGLEKAVQIHDETQLPYIRDDVFGKCLKCIPWLEMDGDGGLFFPKMPSLVLLCGDFNCPSHLDDIYVGGEGEKKMQVQWSVSTLCASHGFIDTYKELHPNQPPPPSDYYSWTPLPKEEQENCHDRIDFIYFLKERLMDVRVVACTHVRSLSTGAPWPSDHMAVLAEFKFI